MIVLNTMRDTLRPHLVSLLLLCLLVAMQACSSTKPNTDNRNPQIVDLVQTENQATVSNYIIRPGDEIEILVWEQPSFNTLATVSRVGTIAIPLVGEIAVTGLTQAELKRSLEEKLKQYIRGEINLTIAIRNTDTMIVSIIGMIFRPDNYSVADQTSIFRLIATAGGHTEQADLRKVKLYRQADPENYVELNLLDYLDSGQMLSSTLTVRPGDIVYIPKKENVVREMSEFLRDVVILFGIFRVFG
ncbi:MAG: polysaccharide export protein [Balneolales bacterium]|nr:polysaccharide export protein [Balneolales bacterium]